ncbi:hypothetical protein SNEBB_008800 [Seison nebaliae]|nr:hypothetical protein SNEBB_008800 [Seison nebaliae]
MELLTNEKIDLSTKNEINKILGELFEQLLQKKEEFIHNKDYSELIKVIGRNKFIDNESLHLQLAMCTTHIYEKIEKELNLDSIHQLLSLHDNDLKKILFEKFRNSPKGNSLNNHRNKIKSNDNEEDETDDEKDVLNNNIENQTVDDDDDIENGINDIKIELNEGEEDDDDDENGTDEEEDDDIKIELDELEEDEDAVKIELDEDDDEILENIDDDDDEKNNKNLFEILNGKKEGNDFFNLDQMERLADMTNEDLGKLMKMDSENLFDDENEEFGVEEEETDYHYEDFFGSEKKDKKKVRFIDDESEGDDEENEEDLIESNELKEEEEEEDDDEKKEESHFINKTLYNKEQGSLEEHMKRIEEEMLDNRQNVSWQLKGEVTSNEREDNSLLQEHLDFDQTNSTKSNLETIIDTSQIEEIICRRIADNLFDDGERKILSSEANRVKLKEKMILDQSQSTRSLAEIYEEDYLNEKFGKEDNELKLQKKKVHKDLEKELNEIFRDLDKLSHFHFTPKPKEEEMKVLKNVSSIRMEEKLPTTFAIQDVLAPEEVRSHEKKNLKSKSELNRQEKKKILRIKKKSFGKKKAKEEEREQAKNSRRQTNKKIDNLKSTKFFDEIEKSVKDSINNRTKDQNKRKNMKHDKTDDDIIKKMKF